MAAARANAALIGVIRVELRAAADPTAAPGMAAYMKSTMPFLGVRVPEVRSLTRAVESADPPSDRGTLIATSAGLWRTARFREERYAATALLDTRTARSLRSTQVLPLLAEMIRTGAWWDHVDEVSHRVGDLLVLDRPAMTAVLHEWATDDDRWIRRSAIIAQLGHRGATDTDLLADVITASLADHQFFVAKAIGWALRDYARTDPTWVLSFLDAHHDRMATLSVREASKHLRQLAPSRSVTLQ